MCDDWSLLREFAQHQSETAFATLVARHAGMVYSACLRELRNRHDAEDATQAVFLVLARKAGAIRRGTVIAAWLYRAARFAGSHLARANRRMRAREAIAAANVRECREETMDLDAFEDLDRALEKLSRSERAAILLRFFEERSYDEVAEELQVSVAAAKKRVQRAVERLRELLRASDGSPLGEATAFGLLAAARQPLPGHLQTSILNIVLAPGASAGGAAAAAKGALKLMAWTKAKMAGIAAVAALLIGGTTATLIYVNRPPAARRVVLTAGAPRPVSVIATRPTRRTTPVSPEAKRRFDQAYALEPGQVLKHVLPPFIPERAAYLGSIPGMETFDFSNASHFIGFLWDGRGATPEMWSTGTSRLGLVIHDLLDVPTYKLDMQKSDADRPVPGDWVIRKGATADEAFPVLARILTDEQHLSIRFERREGVRPVLIATGSFDYHALDPKDPDLSSHPVHFYLGKSPPPTLFGVGTHPRDALLQIIGESLGREVICEAPAESGPASRPAVALYEWNDHLSQRTLTPKQIIEAANNIGRQIGLTFTPAQRKVSYWVAVMDPGSAASIAR